MIRFLYSALFASLLLAGCRMVPPPPDVDFEAHFRPCIVRSLGITRWTEEAIDARQKVAISIWAQAGIQMIFHPPIYLDDVPGTYRPNCPEQRSILQERTKQWAEANHEYLIHYVDKLWATDGREAAGLTWYPFNLPGTIHQWGCLIAPDSYLTVVAHEGGHLWANRHPWEIGRSAGEWDCFTIDKYCDIMSYCGGLPMTSECAGRALRPDQIELTRSWLLVHPCNLYVRASEQAKAAARQRRWTPSYQTTTQPAETPLCSTCTG